MYNTTKNILLIIIVGFIQSKCLYATHNRAGEITVRQISEYTVIATVTTYTKEAGTSADRDSITLDWGDGLSSRIHRNNGFGVSIGNNVKKNTYELEHSYPGRGSYTIGFFDPNRIENILNIDYPNSINIPFYVQTTFTLLNSNFQGFNNTVILLQAPIDIACVNNVFIHNPGAYDIDGDSLAFEFGIPAFDKDMPVPNYVLPTQINPGTNNKISLNKKTGTLIWESPQKAGEYNITILIFEYRSGKLISTTVRDMQILVLPDCQQNLPPNIFTIEDTCIIAGTLLEIPISVSDPNISGPGSRFKIEFSGSALYTNPKGNHNFPQVFVTGVQKGLFSWNTNCDLISPNPYEITIKATDNFLDSFGLSALKIIRIKIIGPPPLNPAVTRLDTANLITWSNPYSCEQTNLFKGFSIWKRIANTPIILDSCNTMLPSTIYKKIAYLVNTKLDTNYYFTDQDVNESNCYRIQAEFAKTSSAGFPYNFVSSLASEEVCIDDKNDKPLIRNVDVLRTDQSNGQIIIRWIKPIAEEFDSLINKPPYKINLYRVENNSNKLIFNNEYPYFNITWDSIFIDSFISTTNNQYFYKIELLSNSISSRTSKTASSIFLSSSQISIGNKLSWNEQVPWLNTKYEIYRSKNNSSFQLLDQTNVNSYIDQDTELSNYYCYYIKSFGSYQSKFNNQILINNSEISCHEYIDTIPPCCITLSPPNLCNEGSIDSIQSISFKMNLNENLCFYNELQSIFIYGIDQHSDTILLQEYIPRPDLIAKIDINIYRYHSFFIKVKDKENNICLDVNIVIPLTCPNFELPNAFTPNGDTHNDIFKPRKNQYIKELDFQVFNRWGSLVFETKNPEILWNGNDIQGNKLESGVYYYHCTAIPFNAITSANIQLKGFIEIIDSRK